MLLCVIQSCHFQRAVLTTLRGAGVSFCFFPLLNVYLLIHAKLGLVVVMTEQVRW